MNKFFSFLYRHRHDIFYIFILFLFAIFLIAVLPQEETKNLINYMENKTFDIRQNIIAKNKTARKDIIIVTVDDPSYEFLIEEYGDWPVPRHIYGDIVNYIQSQKPKYVAFDLLFIKSLKRIPNSDNSFVEIFEKYPNIYTGINFDDYEYALRRPPLLDEKITTKVNIDSKNINIKKYTNNRPILQEIIDRTSNIGHINTPKADDGFIRSVPLIINYPKYNQETLKEENDNYYLYMTLKLAIDYLNKYENANIKEISIDKNNYMILGSKKLPLTKDGNVILNWYGNSGLYDNTTFEYISIWEIIKSIKAKELGEKSILPEDTFKDKIVYIGTSVFALSDIKTVPTSKYLPGVEIHTTLLNNILDNNLIHKATLPYNVLICLVLCLAAAYTVIKIRTVAISVTMFACLLFAYMYFATYVLDKNNIWIWIVVPITIAIVTFICAYLIKYLLKSRDFEYTYKLATTDGLTELYNHRFFQETMRNQIEKSKKNNTNFSLILIDIDFFKKFNDTYGHQAGDAVLKHVAKTLKSCVRTEDFVCRYGGEEMTIILNNTNKETATNIANKICKTIAEKKYQLSPDLAVNVTVSLGVATYKENGETPTELIEYADKCLYKAKENGRNQVGFID